MQKIASEANINVSGTVEFLAPLKEWLANEQNGPWIMVIDGLDNASLAEEVGMILPEDCGQLLVTTKTRDVLTSHFPGLQRDSCIHVRDLEGQNLQKIFRAYAWDATIKENSPELARLVKFLKLPALVKFAAEFVTETGQPLGALYDNLQPGKSKRIRDRIYRFFDQALKPFYSCRSELSHETLRLLGELSCLNNEGFGVDLIEKGYPDSGRLWEMLGKLQSFSFIAKDEQNQSIDQQPVVFFMNTFAQRAVREVMEKRMGLGFIMQLHGTALSMLFTLYDKRRQEMDESEARRVRRCSYLWKLPLMPHFERFLQFSRDHGAEDHKFKEVAFEDQAVKSVMTFAQVYLDEGRYDDAVCVLRLTKKLYRGTKNRCNLYFLLLQALNLRLGACDDERLVRWRDDLVKELSEEGWLTMEQAWRVQLELARSDTRSRKPDEAFGRLKNCSRDMQLIIKNGRLDSWVKQRGKLDRKEKELVILQRIEEGRAYLSRAKVAKSRTKCTNRRMLPFMSVWIPFSGHGCADDKDLRRAKIAFDESKAAIVEWFPDTEQEWLMEIDENTADVLYEMGTSKDLQEAEELLKKRIDWLESHCKDRSRPHAWKGWCDVKCKLARVWSKRGVEKGEEHLRKEAINTLEEMLAKYEKLFGKGDLHTQRCARWLGVALKADGKYAKMEDLEKRMSQRGTKRRRRSPPRKQAHSKPTRAGCKMLGVGVRCFVCMIILALVFWRYECITLLALR